MMMKKIDPLQKKEEKVFGVLDKDEIRKKNERAKFGMLTGVLLMSEGGDDKDDKKKRFREDS
jgi:hypothetical protein